jgi:hypothetical protein
MNRKSQSDDGKTSCHPIFLTFTPRASRVSFFIVDFCNRLNFVLQQVSSSIWLSSIALVPLIGIWGVNRRLGSDR